MAKGRCSQLRHVKCELKWLPQWSMFLYLVMVWWRWRICTCAYRGRRMVILRRRLQAYYYCEDDDLWKIVSTIVTNRIIESTLQDIKQWT